MYSVHYISSCLDNQQGGAVQGRGQDVPGGEGDRDHVPTRPPQHSQALRGLRKQGTGRYTGCSTQR